MLSALLGCAFVSRQFWGFVADRIGGPRTILAGSACQITAMIGFLLTRNEAGLFAVSAWFGLGFSGIISAYVLAVRELFPASEASWRIPFEGAQSSPTRQDFQRTNSATRLLEIRLIEKLTAAIVLFNSSLAVEREIRERVICETFFWRTFTKQLVYANGISKRFGGKVVMGIIQSALDYMRALETNFFGNGTHF